MREGTDPEINERKNKPKLGPLFAKSLPVERKKKGHNDGTICGQVVKGPGPKLLVPTVAARHALPFLGCHSRARRLVDVARIQDSPSQEHL